MFLENQGFAKMWVGRIPPSPPELKFPEKELGGSPAYHLLTIFSGFKPISIYKLGSWK
jgi:hypothetical protein